MNEITKEDIEWWKQFLSYQKRKNRPGFYPFVEHILKLAKAVKELQEDNKGRNGK